MSDDAVPARPEPGTRLMFRWRKWDGSPHWIHECVFLGSDRWGDWFGQLPGWDSSRPGREFRPEHPNVTLMPPSGDYTFTHNAAPHRTRVYIDLAWDVRWTGAEPTGIDMDLDVVERSDRGVYLDDQDEWDEHRIELGYPAEVVTHLEQLAADLETKVVARAAPFDDATTDAWLQRLAELGLE
ncbi:DUF402 domain-containing protein [Microbacterium sp. HJ5]